jgi:hemoglobin
MCNGHHELGESPGSCACSGRDRPAAREVGPVQDLEFPAFAFPSAGLLQAVGEAGLRRLVRRHHELLRFGPLAAMFPPEEAGFGDLVERVADYVLECCGGSAGYSSAHGTTCMRTRHFPFSIDETAREVWLEALFRALEETEFPLTAREEYWNWLEPFSVRMVNRRTMKVQPVRIPYRMAAFRFGRVAAAGLSCGVVGRHLCPRS